MLKLCRYYNLTSVTIPLLLYRYQFDSSNNKYFDDLTYQNESVSSVFSRRPWQETDRTELHSSAPLSPWTSHQTPPCDEDEQTSGCLRHGKQRVVTAAVDVSPEGQETIEAESRSEVFSRGPGPAPTSQQAVGAAVLRQEGGGCQQRLQVVGGLVALQRLHHLGEADLAQRLLHLHQEDLGFAAAAARFGSSLHGRFLQKNEEEIHFGVIKTLFSSPPTRPSLLSLHNHTSVSSVFGPFTSNYIILLRNLD